MKQQKTPLYIAADTESTQPQTVYDVPDFTTVPWALGYALVDPDGERKVIISQRVRTFLDDIKSEADKRFNTVAPVVYFHNLAWDGSLLLDTLMSVYRFHETKRKYGVGRNEFRSLISDMGSWYRLVVNWKGCEIEFRDSLKILPMKLEKLCKDFDVEHKKLVGSIDYTIKRNADWQITDAERRYFENDILGLAECLQIAEKEGLCARLTIGSLCLNMYKEMMGKKFETLFPKLSDDLDKALRRAYRGGWCIVGKKNENKVMKDVDGYVYDVNSLYPYSMFGASLPGDREHVYPVGQPIAHLIDPSAEELSEYSVYPGYFRINVDFELKPNHLPFIQIKKSRYRDNEYIERTDNIEDITVTKEDYILMKEQYYFNYIEIKEAWFFYGKKGIFDEYINYWYKIKEQATIEGNKAKRAIAKLFLNNLYGKMSTSPNGGQKIPHYDARSERIKWQIVDDEKDTVYIPAGAYITSYAKGKTIRAAQANYDIFDYADTDSLHCHGKAKGLIVDPVKLGAWANESRYDMARYVRQKTYIEHITYQDGKPVVPHMDIKAAGCPESVKTRIQYKVDIDKELTYADDDLDKKHPLNEPYTPDEMLDRFTFGLKESGKMARKTVTGGNILYNTTFEIKPL